MKKTYRIESARLKNWDYSSEGGYFITICALPKKINHFGNCQNGTMELSEIGQIAHDFWLQIPTIYPMAILDEFIIMPDHIHGIIFLDYSGCTDMPRHISAPKFSKPTKNSISMIINHYKGNITKLARKINPNFKWQSLFHDRIIRDNDELNRIRKYIIENPLNFEKNNTTKEKNIITEYI